MDEKDKQDYEKTSGKKYPESPVGEGYPGGPKLKDYFVAMFWIAVGATLLLKVILPWILFTFFPR
jgi:hypothetical protein